VEEVALEAGAVEAGVVEPEEEDQDLITFHRLAPEGRKRRVGTFTEVQRAG
jgi:hypothetical protein